MWYKIFFFQFIRCITCKLLKALSLCLFVFFCLYSFINTSSWVYVTLTWSCSDLYDQTRKFYDDLEWSKQSFYICCVSLINLYHWQIGFTLVYCCIYCKLMHSGSLHKLQKCVFTTSSNDQILHLSKSIELASSKFV